MRPEALYDIWAPSESVWSRWAKPVLFAQMAEKTLNEQLNTLSRSAETPAEAAPEKSKKLLPYRSDTAVIVNMPGEAAVEAGLQLAEEGYRPVPVFNCTDGQHAAVPVDGILRGMIRGATVLKTVRIAGDAAPVFLIDFNRDKPFISPGPGDFDNRWVIFPQDFPSAIFLRSRGIARVVVLQPANSSPLMPPIARDLYDVLLRWQKGGLEIVSRDPLTSTPPAPVSFSPGARLRLNTFATAMLVLSLASRRNSAGGFGRIIPDPSSGGSYG